MFRRAWERLEEGLIALLLAAMTLLTFAQVVLRYGFNSGFVWALETTTYLFGWLILFAERMLDTGTVFAALLTIAVLGFFFDRAILVVSQRLCDWYLERTV